MLVCFPSALSCIYLLCLHTYCSVNTLNIFLGTSNNTFQAVVLKVVGKYAAVIIAIILLHCGFTEIYYIVNNV